MRTGPALLRRALLFAVLAAALPGRGLRGGDEAPRVVIGSKAFPESWILGEALAGLARSVGAAAVHRQNLGGTEIVFAALEEGSVDAYPEYTGTISQVILKSPARLSLTAMRSRLGDRGIGIGDPLGFLDGYGLAITTRLQEETGLRRVSELARFPQLRLGFSHEFIDREDGWAGLARHYGLSMTEVRGIQHDLAYRALASGEIQLMDVYTTDPQIEKLGLRVLWDDRDFFPRYEAVLLYRLDLANRAPRALEAMRRLEGRIDEKLMASANALVSLEGQSPAAAAALLTRRAPSARAGRPAPGSSWPVWAEMARNTLRHLELVGLSLLLAVLAGVPLGVLAVRSRTLGVAALWGSGLLQTIPSLALLALLIPFLGIGASPALAALFLYGLLPIVRNTYTGLRSIPPELLEAAEALGLPPAAQLRRIRLPLASPAILAGIETTAVINVGTATLAALIGAGGLGEPILRGISLLDHSLILQGAIPAALLALAVHWTFAVLERVVVPRGLRL